MRNWVSSCRLSYVQTAAPIYTNCQSNGGSWETRMTSVIENFSTFLESQRVLGHDKAVVKHQMSIVEKFIKEGISKLPQHSKFRKLYPCDLGPDN